MMFRGYKEANKQLQALTRTLGQRNLELRNARAAAEAANKDREAFSYSVSHDLRAPVRHIAAFSQMLLDEYVRELQPTALRYVTIIQKGARNMAQMIDDLLNLSRIDRQDLIRTSVDLNLVVADVVRELQSDVTGRTIDWQIETLPVAACDQGLIKIVFANLLSNAAKYTRGRERAVIGRIRSFNA